MTADGSVGSIRNGVLLGHERELFLAHGGHFVLDYASGTRQVPAEMFAVFSDNVLQRGRQAEALGAQYRHVIFPDKQSVLRERFPLADPVCLGEVYQRHCHAAWKHVLDLTDVLRQEATAVFKRTDTHPNDYGLAIAAASIVSRTTTQDTRSALDYLLARPRRSVVEAGDLGSKLEPKEMAEESYIVGDWPIRFFSNGITFGNDGLADIYISPAAIHQRRLLWFGDSFGRGCTRLLSAFFSEIVFLRTRFCHAEMMEQIRPDIVITQNAERYFDAVTPDAEAPPFLLYPHLKGLTYTPDATFTEALSALLSYPRPLYQRFVAPR